MQHDPDSELVTTTPNQPCSIESARIMVGTSANATLSEAEFLEICLSGNSVLRLSNTSAVSRGPRYLCVYTGEAGNGSDQVKGFMQRYDDMVTQLQLTDSGGLAPFQMNGAVYAVSIRRFGLWDR